MAHARKDGWYWLNDPERYGWEAVHVQDGRVRRIGMVGSQKLIDIAADLIWRAMSYDTQIRALPRRRRNDETSKPEATS